MERAAPSLARSLECDARTEPTPPPQRTVSCPGPVHALHHRTAQRRPGNHRSDRQGAAGPERRAHHLAHRAARPLRGLHADARTHGRLAQDRQRRRAPAAEAHPAGPRGPDPGRLHHAHRRRRPDRRRDRRRHELPLQPLARHPPEGREEARAGAAASRSRHRAAHPARPVDRQLQSHLGRQRRDLREHPALRAALPAGAGQHA